MSAPYLDVGNSWCVELKAGLLLPVPVPVETLQEEVTDGQPLAGCQLGCKLECVALVLVQFVGSVDVQPWCVHVKCA